MTTARSIVAAMAAATLLHVTPSAAQVPFEPPPPGADYPFAQAPRTVAMPAALWMDRLQYQSLDGQWRDGSLRVEQGRVLLYRDRGARWPLADLKAGTLVDAGWRSKRRWTRIILAGSAAAAGTWAAWRLAPKTVVREGCPESPADAAGTPCSATSRTTRRNWTWGGALAGGGGLTWLAWRNRSVRSMIVLSAPHGQVRLRTAPRSRHEALAARLRLALEPASAGIRPAGARSDEALHPHHGDWVDSRSRPAGTQWLR